jgi:hypothetical protein
MCLCPVDFSVQFPLYYLLVIFINSFVSGKTFLYLFLLHLTSPFSFSKTLYFIRQTLWDGL